MTNYREMAKRLEIDLTPEQQIACDFLERHGFKFCVDFGYENAVAKVWELSVKETVH